MSLLLHTTACWGPCLVPLLGLLVLAARRSAGLVLLSVPGILFLVDMLASLSAGTTTMGKYFSPTTRITSLVGAILPLAAVILLAPNWRKVWERSGSAQR